MPSSKSLLFIFINNKKMQVLIKNMLKFLKNILIIDIKSLKMNFLKLKLSKTNEKFIIIEGEA